MAAEAAAEEGRAGGHAARTTSTEATSEAPLVVAEDIEKGGVVRRGLHSILHLATRWIP